MSKNDDTSCEKKSEKSKPDAVKRKRHFDGIWFFYFLFILIAVAVGVYLNIESPKLGDNISEIANFIDIDNSDSEINWKQYQDVNIELDGDLVINKSGAYHLSGVIKDGSILIDASSEGVVKLILDNVSIKNSSGPAINCISGDNLVIELIGKNYLEDSEKYSSDLDEDINSAIYSKADLSFSGDGSLFVFANYQDGITSKDDLKFNGGYYNIVATDDAIRGKDSVYIVDGDFVIDSGADAIKTTNNTKANKGFVLVEDGNFNISASNKGFNATNTIIIQSGNLVIDSTDDGIHSNDYIGIAGGKINISSDDDGVHADRMLVADGGEIYIPKSYEGIESQTITINDGIINIISSDDGINAGGGADNSSMNREPKPIFDADEDCILTINGGEIYIDSSGDGIDSNGWIYINGGNLKIDGPTNDGNGALDSGMGIVMNGGEVIAAGSSGMAETLGDSSMINNISVYFSTTKPAKTNIVVKNADNEPIIEYVAKKSFNHIAIGSNLLEFGQTYTIYINGEKYESFFILSTVTTIGDNTINQQKPFRENRH